MTVKNLDYLNDWQTLVSELMKHISIVSTENPPKEDKITNIATHCNPKIYDGKYDLEE